MAEKIPADYHALARNRNFKWLGPIVSRTTEKTHWECAFGHRFQTSYHSLKKSIPKGTSGCPICAIQRRAFLRRKKPPDYHHLAREKGLMWLGPRVNRTHEPTWWRCSSDHRFEACYSSIASDHGCPICAIESRTDLRRKRPRDYHRLAQERGFLWIGPRVANTQVKTVWECPDGHRWEAKYNDIHNGCGCPICFGMVNGAYASPLQRTLCDMVNGELNYPCGNLRIDVALPDSNVAIEYDAWYWHGHRMEEDAARDREIISAGWKILHIKSNSSLPSMGQLHAAISNLKSSTEPIAEIILDDWGDGPTIGDL